MNDTLVTIIAIFIAAILMFVFPLMTIADRNDDIAQQAVQQETVEFVDKERNIGAITQSDLAGYKEKINATGHTFDTSIELKIADENVGKKTSWSQSYVIGEQSYYSVYTESVEQKLYSDGKYALKEGDIISVVSTNTDTTIGQSLRNAAYLITGKGTYKIQGQHAGAVLNNGSR